MQFGLECSGYKEKCKERTLGRKANEKIWKGAWQEPQILNVVKSSCLYTYQHVEGSVSRKRRVK